MLSWKNLSPSLFSISRQYLTLLRDYGYAYDRARVRQSHVDFGELIVAINSEINLNMILDIDGLYIGKIPLKLWLKMNDPEDEIFRRSWKMISNFVSEVKAPPTGKVVDKLINLDEALEDVIELIHHLIVSLDEIKNKAEILERFFKSERLSNRI